MGKRAWFRAFYTDHPLFVATSRAHRPDEVWANTSQDKIRVYCTPCLVHEAGVIVLEEERSHTIPRAIETIKLSRTLYFIYVYPVSATDIIKFSL